MSDPHLNIFHAYRGATSGGGDHAERARERQLEDNLTRALLITLQAVQGTAAQGPLLRALGAPDAQADAPYQCLLQVTEPDPAWRRIPVAAQRMVALHGGGQLQIGAQVDGTQRGRADAVIAGAGFLLMIEAKLGPVITAAQLERHRTTLEVPQAALHAVSWHALARAARDVLWADARRSGRERVALEPVARFVLEQWEGYLQMNGFGGFTEEHLLYFLRRREQRDELVRDGIRRSMEALTDEIVALWGTTWQRHVGNIAGTDRTAPATEAWARIAQGGVSGVPHLSLGLRPDGLVIHANVETDPAYRRFQDAWRQRPEVLLALLRELGAVWPPTASGGGGQPWRLAVARRIMTGPRRFTYAMGSDTAAASIIEWPTDDQQTFITHATARPAGEAAPEIMLIRQYPSAIVLEERHLAARLVEDAHTLEPYFAWLGMPVR